MVLFRVRGEGDRGESGMDVEGGEGGKEINISNRSFYQIGGIHGLPYQAYDGDDATAWYFPPLPLPSLPLPLLLPLQFTYLYSGSMNTKSLEHCGGADIAITAIFYSLLGTGTSFHLLPSPFSPSPHLPLLPLFLSLFPQFLATLNTIKRPYVLLFERAVIHWAKKKVQSLNLGKNEKIALEVSLYLFLFCYDVNLNYKRRVRD
jgi:hypothetical protein